MFPLSALEPSAAFVLSTPNGERPPLLERVGIDGQVDGALFTLTLRQTWRHTGPRPLEVIYTFPLPPRGLLLSFTVTRGQDRLEGTILPRAQAEARYEQALEQGDAPALLEVGPNGMHIASLGNLEPGETAVLEVRFAQLLRFDQGRLRLVVPTTVAPRYGQPEAAGLAPHQVPVSSVTADYPLSLGLTIAGSLAGAQIACPTHRHRIARGEGRTRLDLEPGARMDRDVVVVLRPVEPRPGLLVTAADPLSQHPRQVALAAFELPRRSVHRPLSLKLLVDCSGSMAGDSIASAQAALRAIADRLCADDEVALVCFGSSVHTALRPTRCDAATLHLLRQHIDATQPSMGGTEMERALQATLDLPHSLPQADILLITDGQVWQSRDVADRARQREQRVFAIGVGSAPAEGALREIAEASGGACDFATPGEDLQAATVRMVERMRDAPWRGLVVDWGRDPLWQTPLAGHAFGGDTVMALAAFDGAPPTRAALACSAGSAGGAGDVDHPGEVISIPSAASEACDAEVLARLVADRERVRQSAGDATATALRYRLLTAHTHCVLVHQRADGQRTTVPADLVRVPSMMAAGWGGTGSVAAPVGPLCMSAIQPAAMYGAGDSTAKAKVGRLRSAAPDVDFSEAPQVDDRFGLSSPPARHPLLPIADLVAVLPAGEVREVLRQWAAGSPLPVAWIRLLAGLRSLGLNDSDGWILIVHWAQLGSNGALVLPSWAQAHLDAIDPDHLAQAMKLIEAAVGSLAQPGWSRRARRLSEALRR